MKFSVLMSVYFKENPSYLDDALKSIFNQTILPNEIVLIKDGILTNDLEIIINKYVQQNPTIFKIIEFEKNQGLGTALRKGVLSCSHEIIARMDTDDIASKHRFQKQLELFKEHTDIDIVGSYIKEFEDTIENIVSMRIVPTNDSTIKEYAKKRNPFNHMTVMFRKKAVLEAGNYQPLLWNEDYYLWVRMIVKGSAMYNIPESLVYARVGSNMYERRGGTKYVIADIQLQRAFKKIGFTNSYEAIKNIVIRTPFRLIPSKLRGWVYLNLLRKHNNL